MSTTGTGEAWAKGVTALGVVLGFLVFVGTCLDRDWCGERWRGRHCTDQVLPVAADRAECPPGAVGDFQSTPEGRVLVCQCPRGPN